MHLATGWIRRRVESAPLTVSATKHQPQRFCRRSVGSRSRRFHRPSPAGELPGLRRCDCGRSAPPWPAASTGRRESVGEHKGQREARRRDVDQPQPVRRVRSKRRRRRAWGERGHGRASSVNHERLSSTGQRRAFIGRDEDMIRSRIRALAWLEHDERPVEGAAQLRFVVPVCTSPSRTR